MYDGFHRVMHAPKGVRGDELLRVARTSVKQRVNKDAEKAKVRLAILQK